MIDFSKLEGFEWDEGNLNKNRLSHGVVPRECEEVFLNNPLIDEDKKHSVVEKRMQGLGLTSTGRLLFIAFTIRNNKIRVISARDQSKKERREYAEKTKNITTL